MSDTESITVDTWINTLQRLHNAARSSRKKLAEVLQPLFDEPEPNQRDLRQLLEDLDRDGVDVGYVIWATATAMVIAMEHKKLRDIVWNPSKDSIRITIAAVRELGPLTVGSQKSGDCIAVLESILDTTENKPDFLPIQATPNLLLNLPRPTKGKPKDLIFANICALLKGYFGSVLGRGKIWTTLSDLSNLATRESRTADECGKWYSTRKGYWKKTPNAVTEASPEEYSLIQFRMYSTHPNPVDLLGALLSG
ncbi:MAG: hypothetical protein ABIK09_17495 [Pseudomonadota bacterium]